MVDSWQDAAMAWGDTIIPWEDGPLAIRRGTYGRYLIAWAGGGTGRSTLIREVTYTDGTVERVVIPGSHDVPLAAADVWVDGDAPYGEDVESIHFKLGGSSVKVSPDPRRFEVLSDPFNGLAANVVGTEITDLTWESATSITYRNVSVWDEPLAHARPEQKPTQQLALFTTTRRDRELVAEMCAQRRPLLLRSPNSGVDDMWFILEGARTEQRLHAQLARERWRKHTWTLHLLDRPDSRTSGRHVGDTLGDIAAAVPTTLGDIAAKWPTLGDIAVNPIYVDRHVEL